MSQSWEAGSTTRWRNLRAYVLQRDKYTCQVQAPGCTTTAPLIGGHVDHIIPKEEGGTDDPSNLRAACKHCNLTRKKTKQRYEPQHKQVSSW